MISKPFLFKIMNAKERIEYLDKQILNDSNIKSLLSEFKNCRDKRLRIEINNQIELRKIKIINDFQSNYSLNI